MAHVFRYIGKFRKSTMYINMVVDMLRAAILFCLLTIVPTTAAAQFAPVVRGGCTPHLTDGDSNADGSRRQAPLRLASINTNWDSTRVYRQAVILISFSDQDFKEANPQAFYDSLFNAPGFNKRKGPGCVADISASSRADCSTSSSTFTAPSGSARRRSPTASLPKTRATTAARC